MIGTVGLLDSLRQIVAQEASITALRVVLFSLGVLAALAWARRRPSLALFVMSMGGFFGLAYWLVQIVSPMGFETDPAAAQDWAQAGVNALAEPKGAGFVLGTNSSTSLVSALTAAGLPFSFVIGVPALACLLTLGLLILLPFAFLKDRTTAAFAASVALAGGLWPGMAPYSSILLRPSALPIAAAMFGLLLTAARGRTLRRKFNRSRFGVSAGLLAAAALDRALEGGGEPSVYAAFCLSITAIILASPLRAALSQIA